MTGDVHTIRHGYNLADLQQLARAALARGARSGAVTAAELYQTAWSAIAEHLLTADQRPGPYDLIGAGMRATADAIWAGERFRGWDRQTATIRPSYATYWTDLGAPTPGPEGRIVDRTALWQIWYQLNDGQREALLALATLGDYRAAAASLDLAYKTYCQRVRSARLAFLRLWHEGEPPSRVWAADRRRSQTGDPVRNPRGRPMVRRRAPRKPIEIVHGRRSTYKEHGCRCEPCRDANLVGNRAYKARKKAS